MSKTTKQSIDAKIWKILHSETLLSDLTFRFACESFPDFPAYIASAITGETVIPKDVRLQHRIMNPGGRDIITDVMVYGVDGSVYDLEPNKYIEGSSIERGLFHMYLVGSKLLKPGENWKDLRKGTVILLNRHDIFRDGDSLKHFSITDLEKGWIASEKAMKLIIAHVSPDGTRGDEIGELFRDLSVMYADVEMSLPETKKIVKYILDKGVQKNMYEYMREYFAEELAEGRAAARAEARAEGLAEGRAEGRREGRKEGRREERLANAKAMLRGGISSDRVADILKLSDSDMKEIMN